MLIIGLCGGSGSGKGAVCDAFLKLGVPSVDTDAVYHELISSPSRCLEALVCEFGSGIIEKGVVSRKILADMVFSDKSGERLSKLNTISHKYILEKTRQILRSYESDGYKLAIVDAPLLFESGFDSECDVTLCVIADKETRVARILSRDGLTREAALRRIEKQYSDEYLLKKCDLAVYNNGDINELSKAVENIYNKIIKER